MSALVKLAMNSRKANYLRYEPVDGIELINTATSLGIEVRGGDLIKFGGQEDGIPLEGGVVKSNSRALLKLGRINPSKYQILVEVNPQLYRYAQVFGPSIIEPGDEMELELVIHAFKQMDINYLSYAVRLYLID
jgi:hypothetical protein